MIGLTPERLRSLRGLGLRAGFGLVVFVIAFYASFPYHRVKDQVVAMASQQNMDVEIGSAGPILGVGIAFHDIRVANRPTDGTKPTRLRIDDARVSISPMARLMGQEAYSLSAATMGGDVDVDWEASKAKSRLVVKGEDVAMADIPGVKEAINLPLGGKLGLTIDLGMPGGKVGAADGSIRWTCASCVVGDGKAKLKIAGNPMLAEGLSLPRLKLGDFTGRINFEKGVGKLQGVQAKSSDGEIYIEGEIRLSDPLPYSQVDLYIRFKLSDAFVKSSDKLPLMLQFIEAGKRPDGYYGLRLTGSLSRMGPPQFLKTSPFASAGATPPPRPSSTSRPSPPSRVITSAPAVPPPPATERVVDPLKDPNANLPHYQSPPPTPEPVLTPPPAPEATAPPPPPPPPAPPPAPAPTPEQAPAAAEGDAG